MSWHCRLIEFDRETESDTFQIGDMFFFAPPNGYRRDFDVADDAWYWPAFFAAPEKLSEWYRQHNAGRPPLLVWLPGRTLFCVDAMCWRSVDGHVQYYGGWKVTGAPPNITVSPSINIGGIYHGFLQDGVISDDCEGRRYDQIGKRI